MGRRRIITIDGPAGAGKSTVARTLAGVLGYLYLDSGALYRAVAWQARREGLDLGNDQAWEDFLASFQPRVTAADSGFRLFVDGREVGSELRTPEVSRESSRVAVIPAVRRWVTSFLRRLAAAENVVAEGRDMGSVVFPEADVKFYLDADLTVRAFRRRREQGGAAGDGGLEATKSELAQRDRQDETRAASPLSVPQGAMRLDTTWLGPNEVVQQCLDRIRKVLGSEHR